jgi:hypothetical protein
MLMPIPTAFTTHGLLPLGEHTATFVELRSSLLAQGPAGVTDWDVKWRLQLIDNAEILTDQLWRVGITEIFLDGSFVEDKLRPNDIDGYFEVDVRRLASGDLQRELNALDPDGIVKVVA